MKQNLSICSHICNNGCVISSISINSWELPVKLVDNIIVAAAIDLASADISNLPFKTIRGNLQYGNPLTIQLLKTSSSQLLPIKTL